MLQGVLVLALVLGGDPVLAQRAPVSVNPEFVRIDRRDTAALAADADITQRVRAALSADGSLTSRSIAVETVQGQVHLSGFVGSPELVSRAGRVARTVTGVRNVSNHIAVR